MTLAAFELAVPTSVDEVVEIIGELGDDALLLAGGQSVMPMMALRSIGPKVLVDLQRVLGLDQIVRTAGGRGGGSR